MAKAIPLTLDALATTQITPQAATPSRSPTGNTSLSTAVPVPKVDHVPLQIRIPKETARAIKIAAAESEQTISELMLACFHAYMKATKHD